MMTEELWKLAEQNFFNIPHFPGETMLIKKKLQSRCTVIYVYYYYIQSTINGFKRMIIKTYLHKPQLLFDYHLVSLVTIPEH